MKTFIIIVTFNGERWIDKCIGGIYDCNKNIQIIVVDNNSSDGTVSYVKQYYPKILLVELPNNLGFGKANNVGIQLGLDKGADYIFLLNQDAWIDEKSLLKLIEIHKESYQPLGIISPMHLTSKGSALDFRFSIPCNALECKGLISDAILNTVKTTYDITFVNAALWLIPTDVIKKVGVFDPIFPHYGEDLDYVNRVIGHNFKIVICPGVNGFHDREDRQPSVSRDRTMRYLGCLCILKNIRTSFSHAYILFLKSWFSSVLGFLFNLKFRSCLFEVGYGVKLHFLLPRIAKNRKICVENAAFLEVSL